MATKLDIEYRSEAWKQARKGWIGSSDITTILGLNPYCSPLELWAMKTGKTPDVEQNPAMKYGALVEDAILDLFQDKHTEFLVESNITSYAHNDYPWATATPDAFALITPEIGDKNYDLSGSEKGLIEVKHTSVFEGWEDDGAPNYAHCQLIWQMGVLGLDWGFITAVVGGRANDLKDPFFRFDKELFDSMLESAEAFLDCVKAGTPPKAIDSDKKLIDRLTERQEDKEIELPSLVNHFVEEIDDLAEDLKDATRKREAIKAKIESAKENIKLAMKDATVGHLPDGRTVYLKHQFRAAKQVKAYDFWTFKIK